MKTFKMWTKRPISFTNVILHSAAAWQEIQKYLLPGSIRQKDSFNCWALKWKLNKMFIFTAKRIGILVVIVHFPLKFIQGYSHLLFCTNVDVRLHEISPIITAWPGRLRRRSGSETINEHRAWQSFISSCVVCHNGRQLTPHVGRLKTSQHNTTDYRLIFCFPSTTACQ